MKSFLPQAVALFLLLAGVVNAAPSFVNLGALPTGDSFSMARGVSNGAAVIVGASTNAISTSDAATSAVLWNFNKGTLQPPIDLQNNDISAVAGEALAVSANGGTVVGRGASNGVPVAFRFTNSSGYQNLGTGLFGAGASANAVSSNGTVVAGVSYSPDGVSAEATIWTSPDHGSTWNATGIGYLSSITYSVINGLSADGSVAVGGATNEEGQPEAFMWTRLTGMVSLGTLPGGASSSARAISADGFVITGESTSLSGANEAFVWTAGNGMFGLGSLSSTFKSSSACAVSGRGEVVVGYRTSSEGERGFIWTLVGGTQDFKSVLVNEPGLGDSSLSLLQGFTVLSVTGISADGKAIVGFGTNANGRTDSFLATLDQPPNNAATNNVQTSQRKVGQSAGGVVHANSALLGGSPFVPGTVHVIFSPELPLASYTQHPATTARVRQYTGRGYRFVTVKYPPFLSFSTVLGYATPPDQPLPDPIPAGEEFVAIARYIAAPVITTARSQRGAIGIPLIPKRVAFTNSPTGLHVDSVSGGDGSIDSLDALGLNFSKQGLLSGTPLTTGNFDVALSASNGGLIAQSVIHLLLTPPGTLSVNYDTMMGTVHGTTARNSSVQLPQGELLALEAVPKSGYIFSGWTGSGTAQVPSALPELEFAMNPATSLTANFELNPYPPLAGQYSCVVQSPATYGFENLGLLTVTLSRAGSFTGLISLGGNQYAVRGNFSPKGDFHKSIRRGPGALEVGLSLDLHIDLTGGTNLITGTVTQDGVIMDLKAERRRLPSTISVQELSSSYTLAILHSSDTNLPQGDGYGTVMVSKYGAVRIVGQMGDGLAFSQGAVLSLSNSWSLFSVLPGKRAVVGGTLMFEGVADKSDIDGELVWIKPPNASSSTYPTGFTTSLAAIGSKYSPNPVFNYRQATLTVGGGTFSNASPFAIGLTPSGIAKTPTGLTLAVNPRTGLFVGSFTDASPSMQTHAYRGSVFQKTSNGYGNFIGTAQDSGYAELAAAP